MLSNRQYMLIILGLGRFTVHGSRLKQPDWLLTKRKYVDPYKRVTDEF